MDPRDWSRIQQGIFAGESGGDYGALFGYQNRPNGRFSGVDLTKMTVDQALDFANPSGPYGQYVKGQVGRVATPMGAYQIVGKTLRAAKEGLGLRGDEVLTPAMQDKLGQWIYKTQGTGAWEGYKPMTDAQAIAAETMTTLGQKPQGILAPAQTSTKGPQMMQEQKPQGLLGSLGIQKMEEGAEGETGQRFYNRDTFKDTAAVLAQGFGRMGVMGMGEIADDIAKQRTENKARNKTAEYLRKAGRGDLADMVDQGMIGGKEAATAMMGGGAPAAFRALEYQAEAAGLTKGTPEYEQFMLTGGGAPATYRALEMQAEAAGFEKGTPEFKEFMATRGAGLQASARQTATNLAQTETGGEAARVVAAGTAQGKQDVEKASELSEMERNLGSLRVTVDQLSALSDQATYTALGRASNEVRKQLGLEPSEGAVARAEYIAVVDNQILPLLKQTFGAAFTAKEGDTLRATLGDPDKTPAEKKVVLDAFIAQKERDYAALTGGATATAPSGGATRLKFNPETGEFE
jgi:hypothetical protein